MKETKRIRKTFESIYTGTPWLEITLADTLKDITAEQAAKKAGENVNSIWEITNHIISWRKNILQRVNGEVIETPEHNYFMHVADTSDKAWQKTLLALEGSQHQWISFLKELKKEDFKKIHPKGNYTYYDLIQGIMQHDVYHLGQIVLLAKHFTS